MGKFHENICQANIAASQVRGIGQMLELMADDLPRDTAFNIGTLLTSLADEILGASAGLEEAAAG